MPRVDFEHSSSRYAYYASRLVKWASRWLINRSDYFIRYRPIPERERFGKVRKVCQLTDQELLQHFRGKYIRHISGLYAISRSNTCRWIAIDLDCHDDKDPGLPQRNLNFAIAIANCLLRLRFHPLVLDSDGRGGIHILVIFNQPIPSELAYHFGRWLTAQWRTFGVNEPECFPKQRRLKDPDKLGSALRLPGRHHTLPHWTRVLTPDRGWVEASGACEAIIRTYGASPELIPQAVHKLWRHEELIRKTSIGPRKQVTSIHVVTSYSSTASVDQDLSEARRYLFNCPPSVQGQGGDLRFWKTCCRFFCRFAKLSPLDALPLFEEWNARCLPPFSDREVQDKISRAYDFARSRNRP